MRKYLLIIFMGLLITNLLGCGGSNHTTFGDTPFYAIAVSAGDQHSLAVKADGTVWAWGNNGQYELGDGTTIDKYHPVQVPGLTGITAVSAGFSHSLALKTDGTVWAWGNNGNGVLGTGDTTNSTKPIQVKDPGDPTGYLTGVIAISAGRELSIALKNDGTVWTWGSNPNGQLGDGTIINHYLPAKVKDPTGTGYLTGVTAISTLALDSDIVSLALKGDGTVWGWGYNHYYQIGDGTNQDRYLPTQSTDVSGNGLTDIKAIAVGAEHCLALKNDGTVYAWGSNDYSQLGTGPNPQNTRALLINSLSDVKEISAGTAVSIFLKKDGTLWGCGFVDFLGNGNCPSSNTPIHIGGGALNARTLSTGSLHCLFIANSSLVQDGIVWAWGWNFHGMLGDGATVNRAFPVLVKP
jgi:alpha-tubulin suppressor-like RCC1 family protein